MDKDLINHLNAERRQRFQDAAKKLLDNDDVDGAKRQLTWIETSGKVLSSSQRSAQRKWTVIIVCACVLLVGLAWTLRIPSTHVALDVASGNVILQLRTDWECTHQFVADKIFLNNVFVNSQEEPASVSLQGEGIVLDDLVIQADAEIELMVQNHEIRLFVKRASLAGALNVQKAALTIETQEDTVEKSLDVEIPETITFKTARVGAVPVQLRISSQEDWRLRGLQTRALGFVEEYPPGSGNFESVIQAGTVSVLETGQEEELHVADYLELKNAKSRRLELVKAENGVQVIFEGTAAKVLAGPRDFSTNLTPTYFQYVYHQQKLKVFWGAVVFLFGVLWRIRNTIFS